MLNAQTGGARGVISRRMLAASWRGCTFMQIEFQQDDRNRNVSNRYFSYEIYMCLYLY